MTAVIEYVWTKKAQHREHRVSSTMIMKGFIFILTNSQKQPYIYGKKQSNKCEGCPTSFYDKKADNVNVNANVGRTVIQLSMSATQKTTIRRQNTKRINAEN